MSLQLAAASYNLHTLPFNPLNAELNPICHLLALLGAHHIIHVGKIRVKGKEERADGGDVLRCTCRPAQAVTVSSL